MRRESVAEMSRPATKPP